MSTTPAAAAANEVGITFRVVRSLQQINSSSNSLKRKFEETEELVSFVVFGKPEENLGVIWDRAQELFGRAYGTNKTQWGFFSQMQVDNIDVFRFHIVDRFFKADRKPKDNVLVMLQEPRDRNSSIPANSILRPMGYNLPTPDHPNGRSHKRRKVHGSGNLMTIDEIDPERPIESNEQMQGGAEDDEASQVNQSRIDAEGYRIPPIPSDRKVLPVKSRRTAQTTGVPQPSVMVQDSQAQTVLPSKPQSAATALWLRTQAEQNRQNSAPPSTRSSPLEAAMTRAKSTVPQSGNSHQPQTASASKIVRTVAHRPGEPRDTIQTPTSAVQGQTGLHQAPTSAQPHSSSRTPLTENLRNYIQRTSFSDPNEDDPIVDDDDMLNAMADDVVEVEVDDDYLPPGNYAARGRTRSRSIETPPLEHHPDYAADRSTSRQPGVSSKTLTDGRATEAAPTSSNAFDNLRSSQAARSSSRRSATAGPWTKEEDMAVLKGFHKKLSAHDVIKTYGLDRTESGVRNRKAHLFKQFPKGVVPEDHEFYAELQNDQTAPAPSGTGTAPRRHKWLFNETQTMRAAMTQGLNWSEIRQSHFTSHSEESVIKKFKELFDDVVARERKTFDWPDDTATFSGWTDQHNLRMRRGVREGLTMTAAIKRYLSDLPVTAVQRKYIAYKAQQESLRIANESNNRAATAPEESVNLCEEAAERQAVQAPTSSGWNALNVPHPGEMPVEQSTPNGAPPQRQAQQAVKAPSPREQSAKKTAAQQGVKATRSSEQPAKKATLQQAPDSTEQPVKKTTQRALPRRQPQQQSKASKSNDQSTRNAQAPQAPQAQQAQQRRSPQVIVTPEELRSTSTKSSQRKKSDGNVQTKLNFGRDKRKGTVGPSGPALRAQIDAEYGRGSSRAQAQSTVVEQPTNPAPADALLTVTNDAQTVNAQDQEMDDFVDVDQILGDKDQELTPQDEEICRQVDSTGEDAEGDELYADSVAGDQVQISQESDSPITTARDVVMKDSQEDEDEAQEDAQTRSISTGNISVERLETQVQQAVSAIGVNGRPVSASNSIRSAGSAPSNQLTQELEQSAEATPLPESLETRDTATETPERRRKASNTQESDDESQAFQTQDPTTTRSQRAFRSRIVTPPPPRMSHVQVPASVEMPKPQAVEQTTPRRSPRINRNKSVYDMPSSSFGGAGGVRLSDLIANARSAERPSSRGRDARGPNGRLPNVNGVGARYMDRQSNEEVEVEQVDDSIPKELLRQVRTTVPFQSTAAPVVTGPRDLRTWHGPPDEDNQVMVGRPEFAVRFHVDNVPDDKEILDRVKKRHKKCKALIQTDFAIEVLHAQIYISSQGRDTEETARLEKKLRPLQKFLAAKERREIDLDMAYEDWLPQQPADIGDADEQVDRAFEEDDIASDFDPDEDFIGGAVLPDEEDYPDGVERRGEIVEVDDEGEEEPLDFSSAITNGPIIEFEETQLDEPSAQNGVTSETIGLSEASRMAIEEAVTSQAGEIPQASFPNNDVDMFDGEEFVDTLEEAAQNNSSAAPAEIDDSTENQEAPKPNGLSNAQHSTPDDEKDDSGAEQVRHRDSKVEDRKEEKTKKRKSTEIEEDEEPARQSSVRSKELSKEERKEQKRLRKLAKAERRRQRELDESEKPKHKRKKVKTEHVESDGVMPPPARIPPIDGSSDLMDSETTKKARKKERKERKQRRRSSSVRRDSSSVIPEEVSAPNNVIANGVMLPADPEINPPIKARKKTSAGAGPTLPGAARPRATPVQGPSATGINNIAVEPAENGQSPGLLGAVTGTVKSLIGRTMRIPDAPNRRTPPRLTLPTLPYDNSESDSTSDSSKV